MSSSVLKPRRIGLLSTYGNGNLGDAATQEAVIWNLQKQIPNAKLYGISANPEDTLERHGLPGYPLYRNFKSGQGKVSLAIATPTMGGTEVTSKLNSEKLSTLSIFRQTLKKIPLLYPLLNGLHSAVLALPEIFKEMRFLQQSYKTLRDIDDLVFTGSNQLDDYWSGPFGHVLTVFKWTLMARLAGTRVVFLSVGAGPLRSPFGIFFAKRALTMAQYRSYRDEQSKEVVESVGFRQTHFVFPDLAHSLKIPERKSNPKPKPIVGLSPLSYRDPRFWPKGESAIYQQYVNKLTDFSAEVLQQGYGLAFFPSQLKMDPYVIADIKSQLLSREIDVSEIQEPKTDTVTDLLLAIQNTDYMVACRFHGVLLSLLLCKPVLAISYAPKIDVLMQDTGQGLYTYPIETFSMQDLKQGFANLEKNSQAVSAQIALKMDAYRQALNQQYQNVFGS